ncbi:MAG: hypothetical protein GEV11_22860 [Streptosporangiales bacterium]|nr:hypothetical protein [Streptosporangiales bacterium]
MVLAALMTIAVTGVRAWRGDPHTTPVDACALVTAAEARSLVPESAVDRRSAEPAAGTMKSAACRWRADSGGRRRPALTVETRRWTPASRFRSGAEVARQEFKAGRGDDGGEDLDGLGDEAYLLLGEGRRPTVTVVIRDGNVIMRAGAGPIPADRAPTVRTHLTAIATSAAGRLP